MSLRPQSNGVRRYLRAPHQLLPQPRRRVIEHEMGVGCEHVPGTVLQLIRELARLPSDETGDKARIARLAANDVVDRLLLDRGIKSRHHWQRLAARTGASPHQREKTSGGQRAA